MIEATATSTSCCGLTAWRPATTAGQHAATTPTSTGFEHQREEAGTERKPPDDNQQKRERGQQTEGGEAADDFGGGDAGAKEETQEKHEDEKQESTKQQREQQIAGPHNSQFATSAWPAMDPAALHGIAGEVVRAIEPHSEADPNGILVQFLVAVGNAIGDAPYYQVEGDKHRGKLFLVTSGTTAKGRKGTALGRIRQIMKIADPDWESGNIQSGLSSGEGIIFHVRDPVTKANNDGTEGEIGVGDKRLMLVIEEFVSVLSVMERPGNTLSPVLRDAWGTARLQTLTKNSPLKATGSHVSIIAHVTDEELRSALTRTEMANGFANRFIYAKVRRSKELPHGGSLGEREIIRLGERTKTAIETARGTGRITMTPEAALAWERVYGALSSERPGLLGAILGRAEAQVIRLALIYALLDRKATIEPVHIEAGLAVWEFCEESAEQIFGDLVGDNVADTILKALKAARSAGMSRTEISGLFLRHVRSARIAIALDLLQRLGKAKATTTPTDGRWVETWHIIKGKK